MDAAYLSGFSALAGSAIGAFASVSTTWLTQHHQDRSQRMAQENARRETLYGDFIDQSSKLFTEALIHSLEDPSKLVTIYGIISKMRLFSSRKTIESAVAVVHVIVATYYAPNEDFGHRDALGHEDFDLLRSFTEACREELGN